MRRTTVARVWSVLRWPFLFLAVLFLLLLLSLIVDSPVWNLLELLIVPTVLALAVWWLNKSDNDNERRIANKKAENDLALAVENQRQTTLEDYFDRMSDLLLKDNLASSEPGYVVRNVAVARTLSVLRRLDHKRNKQITQFLKDTGLYHVLSFRGAELRNVDLRDCNLESGDFSEVDFTGANLSGANLAHAKLEKARLHNVDLEHADLRNANLSGASVESTKLTHSICYEIDLRNAIIRSSNFTGSIFNDGRFQECSIEDSTFDLITLTRTNFERARIWKCSFSGSITQTCFDRCMLSETTMQKSYMVSSTFTGASLHSVDLSRSEYSLEALVGADSIFNVVQYDGTQYPNRP